MNSSLPTFSMRRTWLDLSELQRSERQMEGGGRLRGFISIPISLGLLFRLREPPFTGRAMMRLLITMAARTMRALLLMLFAAVGTILLVRFAPGFFSDAREMDARYAQVAQAEMQMESARQQRVSVTAAKALEGWLHGDLGTSRQYQTPVVDLLTARIPVSALLLGKGIVCGWLLAICAALPISGLRGKNILWGAPFTVLLAIPVAAMATACIVSDAGGPVLVLSLLIAAREFKFLQSLLESAWRSPHLLLGRAQGMRARALLTLHILPNLAPQLCALATLSLVTALGALIPVEVVFTVPGVGELAWSAVMNRDLPVLATISLLMACAVGLAGWIAPRPAMLEVA